MFEDPELPDFDSMSQEELIHWLEELAKIHGAAGSEFIDDYADAEANGESADHAREPNDSWSEWLDDTQGASAAQPAESDDGGIGDNFADADEETPVDLARFDASDSGPLDAAAMAWLAEISAAETEEELPEITDYRPPAPPPDNLGDLLSQSAQDDPLEWLDGLSGATAGPRLPTPSENEPARARNSARAEVETGEDFDDAYEDDESLDDLEDESLYTQRPDKSAALLESILGMSDRESEEYSTQSMAPVPDDVEPAAAESSPRPAEVPVSSAEAAPARVDGLTQAFMPGDAQVDLEAWYLSRLRQISNGGEGTARPQSNPALDEADAPAKPPPPGLAAAIYSARGKVDADELRAALTDYETLLRTSAGLEWVVSDMRGLIARAKFRRHPSVHRVLGDALMRQGHLDAALDVYRHALTLL